MAIHESQLTGKEKNLRYYKTKKVSKNSCFDQSQQYLWSCLFSLWLFYRQVTVEGIAAKGDILINSNHEVQETRAKLDSLSAMWTELKAMSDKIRRELQDALDMYNLQSAIDAIQSVVREKEYMSNVSGMLTNAVYRVSRW